MVKNYRGVFIDDPDNFGVLFSFHCIFVNSTEHGCEVLTTSTVCISGAATGSFATCGMTSLIGLHKK